MFLCSLSPSPPGPRSVRRDPVWRSQGQNVCRQVDQIKLLQWWRGGQSGNETHSVCAVKKTGKMLCIVVSFGEENVKKMSEVTSLEGGGLHSYTASTCGYTWLLYLALQLLAWYPCCFKSRLSVWRKMWACMTLQITQISTSAPLTSSSEYGTRRTGRTTARMRWGEFSAVLLRAVV